MTMVGDLPKRHAINFCIETKPQKMVETSNTLGQNVNIGDGEYKHALQHRG